MEINIRKAKAADLNNLAVLKQQVWISTYATEGLTDEFSSHVLSEYSIENVRKSITDKSKLILIATVDENMIGCAEILLSPKRPVFSVEPCLEISTLYVLERFQGTGAGKKLLQACMKEVKQMNYDKTWLTVYYKNTKVIEFYRRHYFSHIGDTDFILGKNRNKNYIMLRNKL